MVMHVRVVLSRNVLGGGRALTRMGRNMEANNAQSRVCIHLDWLECSSRAHEPLILDATAEKCSIASVWIRNTGPDVVLLDLSRSLSGVR